jgi:hypothetical protein
MKRPIDAAIFIVCLLYFLLTFLFCFRATNIVGLLLLPVGLLFLSFCLISLVKVFTDWKTLRWRSLIPLATCIFVFKAGPMAGNAAREMEFKHQFPKYDAVIQKIESGAIPLSGYRMIPTNDYDSAIGRGVSANQTNGVLTVEFWYGGAGPPPYHQVFVYVSNGNYKDGYRLNERLPNYTQLQGESFDGKWFFATD